MTTPFTQEYLFEINDNLQPILQKTKSYEYITIDNFYKRPENIYNFLKQTWVQNWKKGHNSANFVEYYDCRLLVPLQEDKTILFFQKLLNIPNQYCDVISTNIFKWINPPSQDYQFSPHQDLGLNIIVYLDKINSGGTALYNKMPNLHVNEDIDIRFNIKENNLNYELIQSVFNRCVIFNGQIPHGGYISNHNAYIEENWRYNAVYFFKDTRYKEE